MDTIKFEESGEELISAENDTFSWKWTARDMLTYKPTGQTIYQNDWYEWKNSQPINDTAIIAAKKAFWVAIYAKQEGEEPAATAVVKETRGNGWCDKCQSYCYGDCEA